MTIDSGENIQRTFEYVQCGVPLYNYMYLKCDVKLL